MEKILPDGGDPLGMCFGFNALQTGKRRLEAYIEVLDIKNVSIVREQYSLRDTCHLAYT